MVKGRWRHLWSVFILLLGVVTMVAACRPTAKDSSPKPAGIVKHFGAVPLTLELRLDRERLTVAEQLTVLLLAETDEEHALKFIKAEEFVGFTVTSASETKPELIAAGRVAYSFRYVLEPLAAGNAQVPILTVEAWKKAEADAAMTTVNTEPVPVTVVSLLAKDDSGATISDIAAPLAKPFNPWLLGGLGLAGCLALALILYVIRKRQRRVVPPPPPLPPHLLAYEALNRLLATDLLANSQIKDFYEALSAILRHYIEQRFGLHAPEQTTEEFLAELRRGFSPSPTSAGGSTVVLNGSPSVISTAHTLLLRDFLSHCDLVKFARHTPARSEAEESVERCRRFVRETEPVSPLESKPAGGEA